MLRTCEEHGDHLEGVVVVFQAGNSITQCPICKMREDGVAAQENVDVLEDTLNDKESELDEAQQRMDSQANNILNMEQRINDLEEQLRKVEEELGFYHKAFPSEGE